MNSSRFTRDLRLVTFNLGNLASFLCYSWGTRGRSGSFPFTTSGTNQSAAALELAPSPCSNNQSVKVASPGVLCLFEMHQEGSWRARSRGRQRSCASLSPQTRNHFRISTKLLLCSPSSSSVIIRKGGSSLHTLAASHQNSSSFHLC